MRQKNLATARNTAWRQKKGRKRNISTVFLLLFPFLFFCLDFLLAKPNRKPKGKSLSDAVQLIAISEQNRGQNELRVWEGASKVAPDNHHLLYSFPCVSSPSIKAGYSHTLLMNRMWQVLKSHFHDMIPSWIPSWASILDIFPCPLTSSFYGKPGAPLRVHMKKKKKEVSSPARNWGPQSNNPKELKPVNSHVNDLRSRSLSDKSLDRLQPSERTWVRVSK